MSSRRTFIKQAGLATAGSLLLPSLACTPAASKKVGLQLFTMRDYIVKDVKGVITKIAQAGYKEVETFGYSPKDGYFGMDLKSFASLLKDNGLKAPSGHFAVDDYVQNGKLDELKPYIDSALALDMKYFTAPWLNEPLRTKLDDFKKIAARLNELGAYCKKQGIKMAYHNHDFEFHKYGDTMGYNIMLEETDKDLVDFELDLYWAVRSGNDPIALFNKYPGRFAMWHVKDMDKQNNGINTEVGKGAIDFKRIYKEAKLSGLKHLLVEQENFSIDPYVSIKQSIDYVNRELV